MRVSRREWWKWVCRAGLIVVRSLRSRGMNVRRVFAEGCLVVRVVMRSDAARALRPVK